MSEVLTWGYSLPQVSAFMEISIDEYHPDGHVERKTYNGNIPEELMDQFADLVGNGLARISVGADIAQKDYGNGTGGSVTVTVTCNQDGETMARATALAQSCARTWCKQHQEQMQAEFDARREAERAARKK